MTTVYSSSDEVFHDYITVYRIPDKDKSQVLVLPSEQLFPW